VERARTGKCRRVPQRRHRRVFRCCAVVGCCRSGGCWGLVGGRCGGFGRLERARKGLEARVAGGCHGGGFVCKRARGMLTMCRCCVLGWGVPGAERGADMTIEGEAAVVWHAVVGRSCGRWPLSIPRSCGARAVGALAARDAVPDVGVSEV
jgi:hypothetical protein